LALVGYRVLLDQQLAGRRQIAGALVVLEPDLVD
jgi:hypothetical protein